MKDCITRWLGSEYSSCRSAKARKIYVLTAITVPLLFLLAFDSMYRLVQPLLIFSDLASDQLVQLLQGLRLILHVTAAAYWARLTIEIASYHFIKKNSETV